MKLRVFAVAIVLALAHSISIAGLPRAECPELSPAELKIQTACDRNAECSRITDQYSYCPKLRIWLTAVAPANGKEITALDLERGLSRARSSFLLESESSVRLKDCLGTNFRLIACRTYLGLEQLSTEYKVADLDPALPEERTAVDALLKEGFDAKYDSRAASRGESIDALKACEEARNNPNRVQICRTAQEKYEVCKQKQTQWSTKRTALLAQLNQRRPDLGHSCLVPAIRGMSVPSGTQKTDQWNCALSSLRTLQMPGCPGFLPSSFQTPLQALAMWNEEDRRKVSGASTDKAEAAGQSANLATDLFQQSAAKASKLANDPQTTAKLAAAAKARENEINKLTNDGIERQSAIMGAAVGAIVGNVTTSLQSGSYGNMGGSSDLFGALGNTMTNIKQYAPADAGINATTAGLIAGSDLGVEPGSKNTFVQSKVLAKGTSCQARKASLERELPEINARQPRNASTVSQLQAILYMTERSIAEFSTADCSSDPNSSANLAEYRQAHANTLKTCRQVASNPNDCIAKISW